MNNAKQHIKQQKPSVPPPATKALTHKNRQGTNVPSTSSKVLLTIHNNFVLPTIKQPYHMTTPSKRRSQQHIKFKLSVSISPKLTAIGASTSATYRTTNSCHHHLLTISRLPGEVSYLATSTRSKVSSRSQVSYLDLTRSKVSSQRNYQACNQFIIVNHHNSIIIIL